MPTALGNYFGNGALADYFQNGPVWLALHLSDPTPAGNPATEFGGGGYLRQRLLFGAPSAKQITNTGSATFSALTAATVPYFGFWTAQSGGFMLADYELSPAGDVTASSQFLVAPGDIVIQL